jgi:FkbM family methyltransferase
MGIETPLRPSAYQHILAALFRLYPFYSGTASIPNHHLFKRISGPQCRADWTKTPGGEIFASLDDFIGRAAFFSGDLDPKVTWIARKLVKPGDIVFDVGANVGILTLLFSELVGTGGKVHAFEPNPRVMRSLRSAVERKQVANVELNEVALGCENGVVTLKTPLQNQGEGSIVKWRVDSRIAGQDVRLLPLDGYVSDRRIERIDVLKIDVEGAEIEVLLGAQNILRDLPPNVIIFEDSDRVGSEPTAPMKLLSSFGYEFVSLPKNLFGIRPEVIRPGGKIVGWDLVAAKRGLPFDRLCNALGAR